jgi:NTP pyrophosphatase (non-canonical NTP hydrolase)
MKVIAREAAFSLEEIWANMGNFNYPAEGVGLLKLVCGSIESNMGWATPGKAKNFGETIALIHSEVSEALEGGRKGNRPDPHCPLFGNVEIELADAIIRIMGLCYHLNLDIESAIAVKLKYNLDRPDHKLAARAAEGGKKF